MVREMDFVDECYADKDLSLLKKLTLVIPTYNRNYYLSRCLWYHAHFPFGQIIVADSSPEEKKVVNRETVAKVREMFGSDILYLEYEPETEKYGGDIYRKWGDAVMHVETEYSQICGDKEFISPKSLVKCIAYLNDNHDYVAISGAFYQYTSSHDIHNRYFVQIAKTRTSEELECGFERYMDSLFNVGIWDNTLQLSLSRTKEIKYIYNLLDEFDIKDIRYGELITALSGHLQGKFKYFDDDVYKVRDVLLHSLSRQKAVNSKSPESSTTRYPKLSEYAKDRENTQEFTDNFESCLFSILKDWTELNDEEIVSIIDTRLNYHHWEKYWGESKLKKPCLYAIYHKSRMLLPTNIQKVVNYFSKRILGINAFEVGVDIKNNSELQLFERIILDMHHYSEHDLPIV